MKPNDSFRAKRELVEKDAELLADAIVHEKTSVKQQEMFEDIQSKTVLRGFPLSEKQRAWVTAASKGERYEAEEEYQNSISSGAAPRGREVPLLVDQFPKPKQPPGRT
jgi:hypothetical protein